MKKIILSVLLVCLMASLFSQNVGIGTNNPINKLTVYTPDASLGITHTNNIIRLSTYLGSGAASFGTVTPHSLNLMAGNWIAMTINTTGFVGIGTTTPNEPLTIFNASSSSGLTHTDGNATMGTFVSGSRTKIGSFSNHPFGLIAGAIEWLTILPTSGYVGIGIQNPVDPFVVATTNSSYGMMHTDGIISVGSYIAPGAGWIGTKTNNPLGLFTNGNVGATLLTNGNFGVGTTAPAEKLTVQTAVNNYGFLQTNGSVSIGTFASSTSGTIGTKSNHPLGFFTNNGAQQITLLQNGNVGFGTSSPQVDLHINPSGLGSILLGTNKSAGGYTCLEAGISAQSGGHGYVQTTKSSGSSYGALLLNPYGGNVGINHSDNTFLYPLDINQRGLFGMILRNTSSGDAWELYTEAAASSGVFTFSKNNSITAQIANNGAYIQVSDARFKKNITSLDEVLAKVLKLQPKRYEYKSNNPSNESSIGFIAQEVVDLFPSLTAEIHNPHKDEKDLSTYYGVNYAGFSVIAIKAIQEQQGMISDLKKEVDELKKAMEELRKAVAK